MFDTICTLPLTSDLFAQAIHPTKPIFATGLAAGHVQLYRLPPTTSGGSDSADGDVDEDGAAASENGCGTIETAWRTKRHKGSCRCLAFSPDGAVLYSSGTDGVVKAADTETGTVDAKIAVPNADGSSAIDAPALLHALSPQTLLLATDSSALHLYDLRVPSSMFARAKPQQTHRPHDDYISSLTPLPPTDASTSGFSKQWVSTGGTTLAVTDLRRGVLVKSEDQEEELLSSVFVAGLPAKGKNANGRSGEKVLVGGGSGVLTLWEKGVWDDQDERIVLDKDSKESLDVMAIVPGRSGDVVVGMGDGRVKVVRLGANKVVGECRHDEVESVVGLGFEVGGRMISGGGCVVKVWHEAVVEEGEEDAVRVGKRGKDSDSDEAESEDERDGSSDEEDKRSNRSKRRKRGKGREQVEHVMAFKGMN